jgi:hypothetical protein
VSSERGPETPHDVAAEILADAGLAYDDDLGVALESLRALRPPTAPKPSGALAELLAFGTAGGGADTAPSRASRRAADVALEKLGPREPVVVRFAPRKRHRGAIISAAVVAGVGLGASGVAALGGVDYSADAPQAVGPVVTAPLANGPDVRPEVPVSTPREAPVPTQPVAVQSPESPAPPAAAAVDEPAPTGARHRADPADDVVAEAAVAIEQTVPAAPAVPAGRHVAAPVPALPAPAVAAVQKAAGRAISAQVAAATRVAVAAQAVAAKAAGAAHAAVPAQAARRALHVSR